MLIVLIGLLISALVTANILELEEGETCTALDGGIGTCKLLFKCETAGDFKKNHPPICSFKGRSKEPIICCPHKQLQTRKLFPGRKALKICNELRDICRREKDHQNTIVIEAFISPKNGEDSCRSLVSSGVGGVGGTEVPPRGHPYMALIGFCVYGKSCDVTEVSWGSGGTLISPRYILSAAHCAKPSVLGPAKWARLGDLDISTSKDDAKPVDKRIVEILVHPEYSEAHVYHDIALFKLDSDVVFNSYILPVCLQFFRKIRHTKANFTGWGRTGFAEATSDKLLQGEINIYNDTECRRLIFNENTTKTPLGLQPDLMICAGVPDGSRDTCTGDSGGPLIIGNELSCLKTQIGITSFGHNCGLPNSPGVYTRVSNYISWIEEIAFKDVVICD